MRAPSVGPYLRGWSAPSAPSSASVGQRSVAACRCDARGVRQTHVACFDRVVYDVCATCAAAGEPLVDLGSLRARSC